MRHGEKTHFAASCPFPFVLLTGGRYGSLSNQPDGMD